MVYAQNSSEKVNVEDSQDRGNILNPLPGEVITERFPMIMVKLPTPTPPLDPDTIKLFLDGDDLTSETQPNMQYISYVPKIPLSYGVHNVLVTYQNTDGESIAPISWSFKIGMKRVQVVKKEVKKKSAVDMKPTTTGRYIIKVKQVDLNNSDRETIWKSPNYDSDIKYQEGVDTTGNFEFTHKFYGKSLTGSFTRAVEQIKGRANDRFSLRYVDNNDNITVGDFYMTARDFSQYTISGVQMRGIKTLRNYNGYVFTTFAGRSQEPHDGRMKRKTYGMKVDKRWSDTNEFRIIGLHSLEKTTYNLTSTYRKDPSEDTLYSLKHTSKIKKNLTVDTEVASNKHSEKGLNISSADIGKDSAFRSTVSFSPKNMYMQVGRRTVGPNFNPTVLGTFTEKDREGSFGTFRYSRPSGKLSLGTFYDVYHDNLHHNAGNNITDQTRNSRSNLTLNYGWVLPRIDYSFGKLYTKSKYRIGYPDTQRSESTNETLSITKIFHNTSSLTGSRIMGTFSRYDIDRISYSGATFDPELSSVSDYMLRSDTRNWNFSTRYKALAQISYNSSYNKSLSTSRTTLTTISSSKSNTDSYAVQLNIVPFKFIMNYNFRRSGRKTYTQSSSGLAATLSAAPLEYQHTVTMIYYIDQKRKLSLELSDYDKQYRALTNKGRSYDESSIQLGYSVEF